jgi:toxin ParE1/3/4
MKFIRFSTEASRDLEQIAGYIHGLNPIAADRFLDLLEETCDMLAMHPLLGRTRPELAENLRSFAVGNYLVFYLPAPDGVFVVRIIYGGRDLPKMF